MFSRRKKSSAAPAPAPGVALRHAVLTLDPTEVGISRSDGEVWAAVMDVPLGDNSWYCLVCIGDGTTSLYTNGSFGIIGAGQWPDVRTRSQRLLSLVGDHLDLFEPATSDDPGSEGSLVLRAMTWSGAKWIVAPSEQVMSGAHPASSIFEAANDVVTAVREQYERQG